MEPMFAEGMDPLLMTLRVGEHTLTNFPPNWSTRRQRTHLTALAMDVTPFCDPTSATQRLCLEFPSSGDHTCWEGILVAVTVRTAPLEELCAIVEARGVPSPTPDSTEAESVCQMVGDEIHLLDPVTLLRIRTPAKGTGCLHRDCFDLTTFLSFCSQLNVWVCPVCLEPCSFDDLRVDGLYRRILQDPRLNHEDITTVTLDTRDLTFSFKDPLPDTANCSRD